MTNLEGKNNSVFIPDIVRPPPVLRCPVHFGRPPAQNICETNSAPYLAPSVNSYTVHCTVLYSVQYNYLQKELDTELNSSHKYFGPGADQNGLGTATLAEASLCLE